MNAKIENVNGIITISNEVIATVAGDAATRCYGVVGMRPHGIRKIVDKFVKQDPVKSSVKVTGDINSVNVELHIVVTYGMNISAIAKSIVNKVKYVIFESTGIKVNKVTVKIDGIVE